MIGIKKTNYVAGQAGHNILLSHPKSVETLLAYRIYDMDEAHVGGLQPLDV